MLINNNDEKNVGNFFGTMQLLWQYFKFDIYRNSAKRYSIARPDTRDGLERLSEMWMKPCL